MIAEFECRILALIDEMVEHASDDDLFAGGYLRGHLTLAVAEVEPLPQATPAQLDAAVRASLARAIHAGELSPPDQALVYNLWQDLYQRAQ
ncbi:YfcL family protein [Edwardsiella tarda]|nr:YfcL family protein [Edwardsiella tarda]AKH88503.1 YfcL family protein [Edwardsiella tarda]ATI65101.1 hypothetical protein CPU03_13100 [Edwardsiella tarda]PEH72117.1 hypothetical protein CRM76_09410 [Edwardsiella tarda]UAL55834.1 YfcL family protein [Edwardsiella tarda]UCQ01107.1 YfcL family protein [Edwardsiella tarda ATCC 15947 = NBRC 105688]